jgi:hypothetical protein
MKLIQSTWFNNYDQIKGNWPDEKFALFSMALSHLLLKKQHLPTRLNTNLVGLDIVVNLLGLEYDEVDTCLEKSRLDAETSWLFDKYWSLHKLYTYSLAEEPFIHFDNDVYFFKKLDESWKNAALVAQNQEWGLPYYTKCLEEIQHCFGRIPAYLKIDPQSVMAVNAGIAGGTNFGFFKQLYDEIISFLSDNRVHLDGLTDGYANIFIEQCLMKNYADSLDIPFKYVLLNTIGPSKEYRVNKFHLVPDKADYIHVMNYKSNATICESIAKLLYCEDRKLYQHCIQIAKSLHCSFKSVRNQESESFVNDTRRLLKYSFRRTQRISSLLSELPLQFDSLEQLSESVYHIAHFIANEHSEVLQDVFIFELDRYRFFDSLNEKKIRELYNNFIKSFDVTNEIDELYISLNESTNLIESRWNWVEGNEFIDIPPNHYLNNIKSPPGYFATLIYYYPEQNIPKEHLLKICDTLIIKFAENGMTTRDLTQCVYQSLIDQKEFLLNKLHIEERIRFFVFQGVFSLSSIYQSFDNHKSFLTT